MYPGTNTVKLSRKSVEKILAGHIGNLLNDIECRIISVTVEGLYGDNPGGVSVQFTTDPAPAPADPLPVEED